MTRAPQRLSGYLEHIIEAIERIGRYTTGMDRAGFMENPMVQDAIVRNFEILGEASHNIVRNYPEFTAAHPELPLIPAYEMRNAVAHGYFSVDLELVWKTIQLDLPLLCRQVRNLAETLKKESGQ